MMRNNLVLKRGSLILVLYFLFFYRNAYAYLNPGTGNLIMQVIVGVLIGGTVAIRMSWRKVRSFFAGLHSKKKDKHA